MLFRGDTPLTPDERLDYEIECELHRLREDGLLMETLDSSGDSVWIKTLRGAREFNSTSLIRITFEMLDSSC